MKSSSFFRSLRLILAIVFGLAAAPSFAAQPLRIGLAASPANDAVRHAVKLAAQQGLDVKIIEFTDWIAPNAALADKSIDVNYFQHIPFLENAKKSNKWDFKAVSPGYISWLGAYSDKLRSIDALPQGAKVAIANDPVNTGRALLFLQSLGIVKLREGADFSATLRDIVDNPKNIKIVEVEAQQVVRALPDVDLGLTFPSFVKLAGKDPNGALVFEKPSSIYAIYWVTRTEDADDARLVRFIKIYNEDPDVKPLLTKLYNGQIGFGW